MPFDFLWSNMHIVVKIFDKFLFDFDFDCTSLHILFCYIVQFECLKTKLTVGLDPFSFSMLRWVICRRENACQWTSPERHQLVRKEKRRQRSEREISSGFFLLWEQGQHHYHLCLYLLRVRTSKRRERSGQDNNLLSLSCHFQILSMKWTVLLLLAFVVCNDQSNALENGLLRQPPMVDAFIEQPHGSSSYLI